MPTPSQRTRKGADERSNIVKDFIKEGLFVGLGAALLTRDKIEENLRKYVEEGKLSSQEAKSAAERIFEKGQSELGEFQEVLQKNLSSKLQGLDLASRSELETMQQRLNKMEKQMQAFDIRMAAAEQKAEQKGKEES